MSPNDSRASSSFLRDVINGQDIIMKSPGTQLRSYCYVLDCATAILTIAINSEPSNAYNISNPKSVITIKDFAEICARLSGQEIRFEIPSDQEKAGFNLMSCSALDATKLSKLGWSGLYSAEDGIAETLKILKTK